MAQDALILLRIEYSTHNYNTLFECHHVLDTFLYLISIIDFEHN